MEIKRNILLTPGPATTSDTVKRAQVIPDICPREAKFTEVMRFIAEKITTIAGGTVSHKTVLLCGSGTAAVDAAINSIIPPERKILIVNNGAYGARMVKIAHAYSIATEELKLSWEQPIDLETLEKAIDDDNIHSVAIVHHETTTGLLNPLDEIATLVKKYNKLLIVDAISSFAGIPIDVKEQNIDFLIASSNKCLQGMPGCSFVICEYKRLLELADYPPRSFYLNLYRQYDYFTKHEQMPFTAPVQCLYALKKAIEEFIEEGMEARYLRYAEIWQELNSGMKELGFTKLLPDEWESRILTTYYYPYEGFDFETMHNLLLERGFTIYPGKITDKDTFRLGNLGAINQEDIRAFLKALAKVLVQIKK